MIVLRLTLILAITISCQHRSPHKYPTRTIASVQVLKQFIEQVASLSPKYTVSDIEADLLKYIKGSTNGQGNWHQFGITDTQAKNLESIYDDLPHMPKVKKFIVNNLPVLLPRVEVAIAEKAFNAINKGRTFFENPYAGTNGEKLASLLKATSKNNKTPMQINEQRVVRNLLGDKHQKDVSIDMIEDVKRRVASSKDESSGVVANVIESVDNLHSVAKLTGRTSIGDGCKSFNLTAPAEVLAVKAEVDAIYAALIEEATQIKGSKLTVAEQNKQLVKAFEMSDLKYSTAESKAAVARLKGKPCNLYK